jgi:hypothetical protein
LIQPKNEIQAYYEKYMTSWYTSNLGDAMLAEAELDRIKTLFWMAYPAAANTNDLAVLVRHDSDGRLHCEVMVYFTPACATLAKQLGAVPCNQPVAQGLGLLAGSEAVWSAYFPSVNL